MSGAVARIARPAQTRRLLESNIKRTLIISTVLSLVGGFAFKYTVGEARKQKYAEFYRNYDAEKEYQIMKSKGLFQSSQ